MLKIRHRHQVTQIWKLILFCLPTKELDCLIQRNKHCRRTCYLALIMLCLVSFLWILFTKSILGKEDGHIPAFNPFSSLLPYLETAAKPVVVSSKFPKIKKQEARAVKKIEPEQIKVSQESLKKSPGKKAVLSRTEQLYRLLKLEDIFETLEGRYAYIDENMVKYFVQ